MHLSGFFGLFIILAGTTGQDIVLEGIALTHEGQWGEMSICSPGTYVYGMRIKIEPDQGIFNDDSCLNGVELLCIDRVARMNSEARDSIHAFQIINSTEGHKGGKGPIIECPVPSFAIGFQFRSEENQALDNTAGNNVNLFCSDGTVLEGYGEDLGDWMPPLMCPRGLTICSIQTQVEGPDDDDTAVNNVNMGCCA